MRKDYPLAFPIILALLVVIVLLIGGMALYAGHDAWGYGINVFTSVVSTVATVLILDRLAERRADRKAEEALKRQLVDDAASTSNEIAVNAIHQMRRKGWLTGEDGLLKEEELSRANLDRVDLSGANLQEADLRFSRLQRANFTLLNVKGSQRFGPIMLEVHEERIARLQGADLCFADLRGANLAKVNLKKAWLSYARLEGANLADANLQGANLIDAIMEGANITGAQFDQATRLPDYTRWTPETDLLRFTNPDHRDFWRSPNWNH